MSSVENVEDEAEVRDEEALIGELTAINVSVYVSLQLRKIATSIKVTLFFHEILYKPSYDRLLTATLFKIKKQQVIL